MKTDVKSKIVILIYLICRFEAQCTKFDEKRVPIYFKEHLDQGIVKGIIKRSADWSKRLSPSTTLETYGHVVAESENVEVTSKPPRIIRRLRIQHGRKQSIDAFKEINPRNRSNERINKIVKIKKIRRKTTLQPVITATEIMTTTRKPVILSSTSIPKITFSSPYAHITVINKETKNPKRKKKNKKLHKYQMVSTPQYDNEARKNGLVDLSENSQNQFDTQAGMYRFNVPHSYSHYAGHNDMYDQIPRINLQEMTLEKKEAERNYFSIPRINNNYKNSNIMITRTTHPLLANEKSLNEYVNPKMFIMTPRDMFNPNEKLKDSQMDFYRSNKEMLKESASQLKEIINNSETNSTASPLNFGDKLKTADLKINESSSNSSLELEPSPIISLEDETSNKTEIPDTKSETELPQRITPTPENPSVGKINNPRREKFPVRFPNLLFGEQNAFSDPFFDTPDIPSSRPGIMSWNHPFSPFYASDSPQNDGYFSNSEIQPYQSDDLMIPDFHHSPQLTSLRRSILDDYGKETTTSEPVTPFSLPKFEIPPIDFNDKGCQTVYKEVKTVPRDGSQTVMKNQKSFIMTRECYFPNGVPTTEQTKEAESTETSLTTNTP